MSLLNALSAVISAATNAPFVATYQEDVGGGCINDAVVVGGRDGRRYFVKLNNNLHLCMFDAEIEGLQELARANALRVPRPIWHGNVEGRSFLVLEYIELGHVSSTTEQQLGQRLAAQHQTTQTQFGWHRNNTIGSTRQLNDWRPDWVEFYREQRLRVQLDLAAKRGHQQLCVAGERLMENISGFFTDYRPVASLLHGDLWQGNVSATRDGEALVFDPAVYFGDREADIAMTALFGGFTDTFYDAYRDAWPLDPGYRTRKQLYNLYHIINHFNIFGGGYGAQAQHIIEQLLSEIR